MDKRLEYVSWVWLRARLTCVVRGHDWKRAVRFLGNDGTQTCRRCGTKRNVKLRPIRDIKLSQS